MLNQHIDTLIGGLYHNANKQTVKCENTEIQYITVTEGDILLRCVDNSYFSSFTLLSKASCWRCAKHQFDNIYDFIAIQLNPLL